MYNKLPTATYTEENIPKVQEHNHQTTEDINSLFSTYRGFGSYKILIEGEPGIGKTILSSEIAARWANKNLLDDKALLFLNQARAGLRPARAWFLSIDSVRMYACVCPPPRLLITSGVMWCDIDPI